jgi:hypothetical protein
MRRWRFKFNLSYPLTLIGAILFLILGSIAMCHLYDYLRLTVQVDATIDEWKVVKKSSSSYPIRGLYHVDFQGKTYHGSSILLPPYHLNRSSAEKAIKNLEKKKWRVWLNPYNPTFSSLEKLFPMKKIIYAFLALGVTLYFWFIETSSKIRSPAN